MRNVSVTIAETQRTLTHLLATLKAEPDHIVVLQSKDLSLQLLSGCGSMPVVGQKITASWQYFAVVDHLASKFVLGVARPHPRHYGIEGHRLKVESGEINGEDPFLMVVATDAEPHNVEGGQLACLKLDGETASDNQ